LLRHSCAAVKTKKSGCETNTQRARGRKKKNTSRKERKHRRRALRNANLHLKSWWTKSRPKKQSSSPSEMNCNKRLNRWKKQTS
jgi:hypothetical protein